MSDTAASFSKVQRTLSYEGIVNQFRHLLDSGELRSGDRIPPERALSERFSVSRATLREAFRVLELMGLIETRLGQGRYVAELKRPELQETGPSEAMEEAAVFDFLEVRKALDVVMAGLAAERATDQDFADLEGSLQELQGERDDRINMSFDLALAQASHNTVYRRFVTSEMFMMCRLAMTTTLLPMRRAGAIQEHRDIFEAVRRHDSEAASAAMLRHVNNLQHAVQRALMQGGIRTSPLPTIAATSQVEAAGQSLGLVKR